MKFSLQKVKYSILLLSIIFIFPLYTFSQNLYINEVMSSNSNNIFDIDGDYPDWLEIYNDDSVRVNLKNYGLSDDDDEPGKWKFPDITIAPKGYLLVFASDKNRKTYSPTRETIIDWGDEWHYKPGSADISSDWINLDFDDSDWLIGKSGFGFGDDDDSTIVDQTLSIFVRKKFTIEDTTNIANLFLHVDYDDGFIAYINGIEVARANMGTSGSLAVYNRIATVSSEAVIKSGGIPELFEIDNFAELLVQGENVIAIQVHNRSATSSDLTLIPFLSVEYVSEPDQFGSISPILGFSTQYLHTNFKISQSGEFLSIANPSGVIIDHLDEKNIPANISWGRYPDGSENFYLFDKPTPGQHNFSNGFEDVAEAPKFNYSNGFYEEPITITLSTESQNTNIYYTLNGNEPTINSTQYIDPITIDKTTVIKAKTINDESLSSTTTTKSYFMNVETSLAVISLSTAPANLWDDEIGIYVEGTNGIPGYCTNDPKNWNQDWERQGTIEFFEPDKTPGFQINCGIKIGGACTRLYPQKTLAIYTRSEFGDKIINYKIFPENNINEYNNINIRNGGQDWWRSMIRDGFMHTIVKNQMNIDCQSYRPIILFINGEYWGIHGMREKHNEHYIAAHYNLDPDKIDILKGNATLVQGSDSHYNQMMSFLRNNDITDSDNYDYIKSQMDIDEYIDYQIAEIYFANIDWPGGNIKYWRPQTDIGKWRWILFDTDLGFGAHPQGQFSSNSLANATSPTSTYYANPSWSTLLFRSLLKNEEFKQEFAQRYCIHIGTTFDSGRVLGILDSLKSLVIDEMPKHLEKWPQSTNLGHNWQEHIDIMEEFAILRPKSARSHLADKFNLPNSSTITIITEPQKGDLRVNDVKILEPITKLRLFDDIATRFAVNAKNDYQFSGWSGLIESSEQSIAISFSENDTLFANFSAPSEIEEPVVTQQFKLEDNYPNPFNPVTTISYEISKTTQIKLSIFDNTGKHLETLVNRTQNPGNYSIKWHAAKYSSGVYFYKIQANGFQETKKCLLLK